jgi:hypothetical protein
VLPATDSVDDAPPRTATSLTLQVNGSPSHTSGGDFSGKLDPGFAGATVRIVYTPEGTVSGDPRSSFERTATTAADGSWADHAPFPFNVSNFGTNNWSARAYFDGDLDHAPSASNTVQFTVGD